MTSRMIRTALAALAALVVGSMTVVAQGGGAAVTQPAGNLLVDGISAQATPIYDFAVAVTNVTTTGGSSGGGAGRADFSNIEVSRLSDAASPQLFRAAVTGLHISSVHINLFKSGPGTSASSYVLHDAVVAGFSNTNGVERIAFTFQSIEVTAGGVTTCFDRASNAAC